MVLSNNNVAPVEMFGYLKILWPEIQLIHVKIEAISWGAYVRLNPQLVGGTHNTRNREAKYYHTKLLGDAIYLPNQSFIYCHSLCKTSI